MSDTTEAAVERLREGAPGVDAVYERVRRHVGGDEDELELALRFAGLFLSKAPPGFLEQRSADAVAHMLVGAFRFLQGTRRDTVDVQVLNPDVDNEGWFAPVTVLRTNVSERPFVVDSIREFLHSEQLSIEHYIYPVLQIERDDEGRVVDIAASRSGTRRESLVHCEVARVTDPDYREYLHSELERRLGDVVRVTDDFPLLVDALNDTIAVLGECARDLPERREEVEEVQAFLRWLRDGGFVFLGYRGYDIVEMPEEPGRRAVVVEPGSGLGILRSEETSGFADPIPLDEMPSTLRALAEGGPLLIISKTNATSTVHRRARMDYIGVKKLDSEGNVVGERRFLGLFTSEAYSEKADRIPILREKLQRILYDAGVQEGSHDYKEIHTIFNSLPKEELFLTSADEIGADVQTVLTTFDTDEVRVTLRRDPLARGVSVMVILAKEKFSGEVRKRIEEALVERFDGEVLNYHLALGEGDQARMHFYLAAPGDRIAAIRSKELEELVRELTRTWSDRVLEGLERIRPPDEARRLGRRYAEAFSPEFKAATAPETAVQDILELEALESEERLVSITFRNPEAKPAVAGGDVFTELNLYLIGERLILSEFMPILENAGLRVIAVNPYEVRGSEVPDAILYSFMVQDSSGEPLDIEERGTLLAETILAVRAGEVTDDRLNQLVILAGLSWREVEVLRAYAAYGFQVGVVPSRLSLPVALTKYPAIARILFRLFEVKFDPEGPVNIGDRRVEASRMGREFLASLSGVSVLGDDRALRRLANLIDATQRTNYYRNGGRAPTRRSGGVPYLSFKFDAPALEAVARTRLRVEVWVRSSRMEGVHLRGGRVSRGGIRYSDRPDDFRTEVLGLVKTQMVKNAVIVPAGSKGGFITLRVLPTPEKVAEEVLEQYKTLIRGLLDLTDNLEGEETVPPENVICHDDPDPYLVVAADKGTAKYSDVANEVAAEYDFWLGDAFASGGSNGYDHKELGITARGAWECVRRHFLERGKDIQSESFTVVGIGDMSGDVFGNGMLLSRQIRLIAAFDHRDIFIDPDPDPELSFLERERLFGLGRTTWHDYDQVVLSKGGMVIPRGTKEVELTPEAREALGLPEGTGPMDGESLIRAVLSAPAELLWNGGVGTYVKASSETHAEVGDAANDPVRVDATDLRAEVVGEGGNLGFTQKARIEYALAGGRVNTDAIDNSGGVDLSDREVNLKILLRSAVDAGVLDVQERNELLQELSDPVSRLVLRDNESQSLAVSLDERRASRAVDDFRDLMSGLEKEGFLDRFSERLPSWEVLLERQEEGKAFTRPELAVLLAYGKLHLAGHLLRSNLPEDPEMEGYLRDYFPPAAIRVTGEERVQAHPLRREIVVSQLTNDLVDLMGAGFVQRVVRDTGRSPAEVAQAWLVAARLAGHRALLSRLRMRKSELPLRDVYRWLFGLVRVLDRTTRWVLVNVSLDASASEIIAQNSVGLDALRKSFETIVTGEDRRIFEHLVRELEETGAESELARNLITLRFLDQLLEILRVVKESGAEPLEVARAFYHVSDLFQTPWLRQAIFSAAGGDRWEQRAAQALSEDLRRAHQRLTAALVGFVEEHGSVEEGIRHLETAGDRVLSRFREVVEEIEHEDRMTLPAVTVAVREMMSLAEQLAPVGGVRSEKRSVGS